MASDSSKLAAKLDTVNACLDELEAELTPLLTQSLPETAVNLSAIQQAKLHVLLPYLTNGLLFVYLKTQGIDPKTHPVMQELDRLKTYFNKIKEAEDPAKRTLAVDKDAATRFIQSAIRQATTDQTAPQSARTSSSAPANSASIHVPVKVTAKMQERAEYLNRVVNDDQDEDGEDEELEVFDEQEPVQSIPKPKKGKEKEVYRDSTSTSKPRKRTAMDVIDAAEASSRDSVLTNSGAPSKASRKKRKAARASTEDTTS